MPVCEDMSCTITMSITQAEDQQLSANRNRLSHGHITLPGAPLDDLKQIPPPCPQWKKGKPIRHASVHSLATAFHQKFLGQIFLSAT